MSETTRLDPYEVVVEHQRAERERSFNGQVVVRSTDVEFRQTRQGLARKYLLPSRFSGLEPETVLDDWNMLVQVVKVHSGKHRHQGGLVIYILEGAGYSIVDEERVDWEAGDLMLLPIRPGGVEHQHFNQDDEHPAKWVAFISASIYEFAASSMTQIEVHPDSQPAATAAAPAR